MSDESTFFVLNVDWGFVRNWVLPYMNENAKRSAESILMLCIHFPLSFPVTFGASQAQFKRRISHVPNFVAILVDENYGTPFMTKRLYANMKKNTNIRIRK